MNSKNELDHSLLSRFYRNREFEALAEFVRRHRNWAIRRAAQFSPTDAEDIVQISILRLIASDCGEDPIESPLGWWNKIIAGAGVDHLRSRERRKSREEAAIELFDPNSNEQDGPEEDIAREQLLSVIQTEMDGLGDKVRRPLVLRFLKNLSYSDISRLLGIPTGTVSSRIHRGLSHIKSALTQRGYLYPKSTNPLLSPIEEKFSVKQSRQEIVDQNRLFASKWDGLWMVGGRSLGRVSSRVDMNGNVMLKWREDTPMKGSTCPQEFPEQAKDRWWEEKEIVLSDSRSFCWSALRFREGASGRASRRFGNTVDSKSEFVTEISPLNNVEMKIQSSFKDDYIIEAPGEGPIVINSLLPLVLGEANHDDDNSWPLRFLGEWQEDEKDFRSTTWVSLAVKAKYLGKIGQPMNQGHLYEFVNMQDEPGQRVSHWETEETEISGTFWEAEGWVYTKEEKIARAMIASTPQ